MQKWILILVASLTFGLSGCLEKQEEAVKPVTPQMDIPDKTEKPKATISQVATIEKKMALTFNGLADEKTMEQILDELDRYQIKASFFLPGMQVAEDPETAKEIISRGHTIHNNTLNHVIPDQLDYHDAYVELALTNKVLQDHLGVQPVYARTRSGDSSVAFEEAAAQLKMQMISYTINPKDSQMQGAEEIAAYVEKYANRGAIIELNTYLNPEVIRSISLIYKNAQAAGLKLTTVDDLMDTSYLVDGTVKNNQLKLKNASDVEPHIIKTFHTDQKEIALTFDDWASDETVSAILDILDKYNIKSTFFLIGKGVERNPPLARLIVERGHEVASHSYNHKVVTTLKADVLQEDLIKNDEVLTKALQEKPINYFRPPQGIIDDRTARAVAAIGVDYIILYDVTSLDWNLSLPEEEVYHRVVDKIKPGSIITMHILDDSHTVSVLPKIIENLQARGYSFKKISEVIEKEEAVSHSN